MAIVAFDGFESYENIAQLSQRAGVLQYTVIAVADSLSGLTNGPRVLIESSPNGGRRLHIKGAGLYSTQPVFVASIGQNLTAGFVGFRLNLSYGDAIFSFRDEAGNKTNFDITLHSTDTTVRTNFGNSLANVYPINSDVFFEIGWICDVANGRLIVKANNVVVSTFTGNTGVNFLNSIVCTAPGGNTEFTFDDFYICDTVSDPAAPGTNTFLSDKRIFLLTPIANGNTPGWTPSAGTNWQNVVTADGDTSYNQTTTLGAEDLFALSSLPPDVASVLAVQAVGLYRKTDASLARLSQTINSSAVEASSAIHDNVPTSYVYVYDIFKNNPANNQPWTPDALTSPLIKVGYRLET